MSNSIESKKLGRLGVIGMKGCEEITQKVNYYLKKFNEDIIDDDFFRYIISFCRIVCETIVYPSFPCYARNCDGINNGK